MSFPDQFNITAILLELITTDYLSSYVWTTFFCFFACLITFKCISTTVIPPWT